MIDTKKDKKEISHQDAERIQKEEKKELGAPPEKKLVGHEEPMMLEEGSVKALEERMLRLAAEFDNYKKRTAREHEMLKQASKGDFILKLLGIVDEFEIALTHMKSDEHKEMRHGMEMIFLKLKDILKKEGVEEMRSLNMPFDPYSHDALRQGEGETGKVVEVIQKGYLLNGKVLRHAKVVVGKGG